jgi:predicted amidohydrolase
MKYTIGVLQLDTQNDKAANRAYIAEQARKAQETGIRLLSLPERMDVIARPAPPPEPLDGETIGFAREIAAKHAMWIHCGSFLETNPDGKPYNTSVLIGPDGNIAAVYRKLHLFDIDIEGGPSYRESAKVSAGNSVVTVETELGRLGLSICYDVRFPELYRIMALEGARILFVPANFTYDTGKAHWESLLRARAVENSCYVVAAAQTGMKRNGIRSYGHSMIIDPWGKIIALMEDGTGLLTAEISTAYIDEVRAQLPSLQNRRADVYGLTYDGKQV